MTFLSVFHQQGLSCEFFVKYIIDRVKDMEVDNEPGNCISDNYNLFSFDCTVFHIQLTLLTLPTVLVGYIEFLDQTGRF